MQQEEKQCCPQFNPQQWDKKTFDWNEKPFIVESIPLLFHIPFPPMIGRKVAKMLRMAERSKRTPVHKEDVLLLFTDPHAFKSEIYLSVTGPVEGAENVNLSGTFVSRVFDGPYNAVPRFAKEMDTYLLQHGKTAKKYYVHYAYCRSCAQRTGHNYMILFARV